MRISQKAHLYTGEPGYYILHQEEVAQTAVVSTLRDDGTGQLHVAGTGPAIIVRNTLRRWCASVGGGLIAFGLACVGTGQPQIDSAASADDTHEAGSCSGSQKGSDSITVTGSNNATNADGSTSEQTHENSAGSDEDSATASDTDITDPVFPGETPSCSGSFTDQPGGQLRWMLTELPIIEGVRSDNAKSVAAADDGAVYIIQRMNTDVGYNPNAITVFSNTGEPLSSFRIPAQTAPHLRVGAFSDGDIAFVAASGRIGSDPDDLTQQGIITRKYTRSGEVVWEHLYQTTPGDADSWSSRLAIDSNDNILVAGQSMVAGGNSGMDMVYFQLDSSGCELQRHRYLSDDEPSDEHIWDMDQGPDGRVYLYTQLSNLHVFENGSVVHESIQPSTHNVLLTPDGKIVLTGSFMDRMVLPEHVLGSGSIRVMNSQFETEWEYRDARPQGALNSQIQDAQVDSNGNIVIVARLRQCSGRDNEQLYVAKYSPSGSRLWANAFSCGPASDRSCFVFDSAIGSDDVFYVVGFGGKAGVPEHPFVVAVNP